MTGIAQYFFSGHLILRLSTYNLSDDMQKKSIFVAYTGGTIGMQRSEHGYIPVSGHLQRQLVGALFQIKQIRFRPA